MCLEEFDEHLPDRQVPAGAYESAALELAAESVLFADAAGRALYVNRAFRRLHGLPRRRVIGHRSSELAADAESGERYAELEAARARGKAWSGIVGDVTHDGGRIELHLTSAPVRGAGGRIVGWIEVGRDVSLERALETQLRHAARMLVADRLAGIIAHDLNNILTGIRGLAELHRGSHLESEDVSDLDDIIGATDRGSKLVQRVLAFSRRSAVRTVRVDVPAAVRESAGLVRRLLGESIQFGIEAEDVPPTLGQPERIEEILLNLASNSRDAMLHGGTFTVRVTNDLRPERAGKRGKSVPYVVLAVTDTGAGMDEATRAHIFEPFFTTKDPGKGTGLGLASVWSIVTEAGGFIEVESAPGAGTTFRIYLPAIVEGAPLRQVEPKRQAEGSK